MTTAEKLKRIIDKHEAVPEAAELRGVVTATYYSDENFTAGNFRDLSGVVHRFAGRFSCATGDALILHGKFEKAKYGVQFKVESFEYDLALDRDGVVHYLAQNPNMKGIGEKRAQLIAEFCGKDFDDIVTNHPEKLLAVKGVTRDIVEKLHAAWTAQKNFNRALTFLSSFGLTHSQVTRLVEKLGNEAVGILKRNPYKIVDEVEGFGFKRADEIARKFKVQKDDPNRIRAAIIYTLQKALDDGHTCLGRMGLVEEANLLLIMDRMDSEAIIESAVDGLLKERTLVSLDAGGETLTALPHVFAAEQFIAGIFRQYARAPNAAFTTTPGFKTPNGLTEKQADAFHLALRHRITCIGGCAGSGKTFLVRSLVDLYDAHDLSVALCAPTGKAAKRLEEMTGHKAQTIHRMLGYDGFSFHRGPDNPIDSDALIVDECFDYKQPILAENGWRYIGFVVNNKLPLKLWSRNPETESIELKPIVRWIKRPAPSELLRITAGRSDSLRSARVIRCTHDHKILTPYGYRKAGEMHIGEEVIVRGYQLTPEQHSILIGSVLGDACIHRGSTRNSPQASFTQGDMQRDYLEFKKKAFGALASKITKSKSGYADTVVWRFNLALLDETVAISKEMIANDTHASGRKKWTPTNRFLEWIDEQSLAIWYMDNGSLRSIALKDGSISRYVSLHTERFSEFDNERLSSFLFRRFGIKSKVSKAGKGLYCLRFNLKNSTTFLNTVEPYIPACMSWKARSECNYSYAPRNQSETCIARIQSIEKIKPTSKFVFDIEVADNHNYIAGNIVVSNCSMLDVPLGQRLLSAIDFDRTNLILVGDPNQLPPVGPGNVLRDIINRNLVPHIVLDQVVRQAGILKLNSLAILDGKVHPTPVGDGRKPWYVIDKYRDESDALQFIILLYSEILHDKLGFNLIDDVQLLTPMYRGGLGVDRINIILQRIIQKKYFGVTVDDVPAGKKPKFYVNDKVIHLKNNYELDVMNGAVGRIVDITADGKEMTVRFDDGDKTYDRAAIKQLSLAYSVSIHRAQGSEFPCVINVVHRAHAFMHHRNLFYTGVTRAKDTAVIIGDSWGIRNCAKKQVLDLRKTFLSIPGFGS